MQALRLADGALYMEGGEVIAIPDGAVLEGGQIVWEGYSSEAPLGTTIVTVDARGIADLGLRLRHLWPVVVKEEDGALSVETPVQSEEEKEAHAEEMREDKKEKKEK